MTNSVADFDPPFLSVILAVRNEARFLPDLLRDLGRQTLDHDLFEVIVVDGRSSDATRSIAENFAANKKNVRLLDNPKRLAGAGRNAGAKASRAPFLLFLDGHCRIPSKQMLASALAAFQSGTHCLSRPQILVPTSNRVVPRSIAATRSTRMGHLPRSKIYSQRVGVVDPVSAGCAYSRYVFEIVGGYNEWFDACEDVDLNSRVRDAGHSALHSPAFAVHYIARPTWRTFAQQLFRYGKGRGQLQRANWRATTAMAAVPFALLVAWAITLIAWAAGLGDAAILAGVSAVLALPAITCVASVAISEGPVVASASIVTFFVMVGSVAAGYLYGLTRSPPKCGPSGATN